MLGRFLAVSALVAACSVAATAWIAVQTTSGAIRKEQGRLIADDALIYDTLLGYAATRPDWKGVQPTVDRLAQRTGRRVVLTDSGRSPFADSGDDASRPRLPPKESAVVNPLSVDAGLSSLADGGTDERVTRRTVTPEEVVPSLAPRTPTVPLPVASPSPIVAPDEFPPGRVAPSPLASRGAPLGGTEGTTRAAPPASPSPTVSAAVARIDPRAVGPFRLSAADRKRLRKLADEQARCYAEGGLTVTVVTGPSGRPRVERDQRLEDSGRMFLDARRCGSNGLDTPTPSERAALDELDGLTNTCLSREGHPRVTVALNLTWAPASPGGAEGSLNDQTVTECLDGARREQLSPDHVAAPALLFITEPDGGTPSTFDLSADSTAKIAGAAALVLALTVGVSVLAGTRLVRPLHALTGAAQRMRDGTDADRWTPVTVPGDSEIGRLAAAFNEMAAHRTRLEEQRKVMVSDVAHELRTPLSNIRGWLEAAQDGIADLDRALVSSLLEEAVQLQHIIDDLQDLAEADAGMLRLHPEPVPVAELLTQVTAAHQARADAAGVTLTVRAFDGERPGSGYPDPWADPVRLRQAVGNLVSNAVRHTPEGGEVTVRAYRDGPDGDLLLEVRDTGEGIAEEHLPYVFDRFWRAEKSRNRRTGGSGLGLSIVRRLTEAHGGTVSVSSAVGAGSVFTLRVPSGGQGTGPEADGTG
ncbi:ATP-binding protein [Streptomyces sp. JNUCC 64]